MPKQHSNRRIFLRASSGLLVAGLRENPGLGDEPKQPTPAIAAGRGRRFLAQLFDPAIGLLPEFRGSKVYWLYHDNYLAAKVLEGTEPALAAKIRDAIKGLGVTGSGKIEILFGEAKDPLPFRHYKLVDVKRVGEKVIRTEVVGDQIHEDWERYSDLLFMAAIAEAGRDKEKALGHFEAGMKTWDGTGIRDRASEKGGLYATYKLALALIAASPARPEARPTGRDAQAAAGHAAGGRRLRHRLRRPGQAGGPGQRGDDLAGDPGPRWRGGGMRAPATGCSAIIKLGPQSRKATFLMALDWPSVFIRTRCQPCRTIVLWSACRTLPRT